MNPLKGEKVKIVLIDSGINTNYSDLNNYVESQIKYKLSTKGKVIETRDVNAVNEHGTAIAMIIRDISKHARFISMNIFDNNLLSDGRILIHAIREAISIKPDIIHLSLGTERLRYKFKLKLLMYKARKNGIIVVSALNNTGRKSYPANNKNVIKVSRAKCLLDKESFFYRNGIFYAPMNLKCIEGQALLKSKEKGGNSLSAAYITGHICRIKYQYPKLKSEPIRDHIKAIGIINSNNKFRRPASNSQEKF